MPKDDSLIRGVLGVMGKSKKADEAAPAADEGKEAVAGDILAAIEAGDAAGLAGALASFVEMCGTPEYGGEE